MRPFIILVIFCLASSGANAAGVFVSARLTEQSPILREGIVWRVYSENKDETGNLTKIRQSKEPNASFSLSAGTYFIHAGFGQIGVMQKIIVRNFPVVKEFVLNAGGVKLNAVAGNSEINPQDLLFNIFNKEQNENGERKLIAGNVKADEIMRLKEGIYHVVSRYGKINASVQTDLEVEAGKVTAAILQHRGAKISLKLVSRKGGAPIANTAWTVLTGQGENVFESTLVAPVIVLAEGLYEASVLNGAKTYVKEFEVKTGEDEELEVLIDN